MLEGARKSKISGLMVYQVVRAPAGEGAVYTVVPVNNLHKVQNMQDMMKA